MSSSVIFHTYIIFVREDITENNFIEKTQFIYMYRIRWDSYLDLFLSLRIRIGNSSTYHM